MRYQFIYNDRLGIRLPELHHSWEDYTSDEQSHILLEWEEIRSAIPDRIIQLEEQINRKQTQLSDEDDFPTACQLVSDIHDLASIINDLNIWFRIQQDVDTKIHA